MSSRSPSSRRVPCHRAVLGACVSLALLVPSAASAPAHAKTYKGAEVYSLKSVRHGRMEMRMRMIRGSGLLSTFFTYKNGSEVAGTEWEELDLEVLGKNDAVTLQTNIITGNPRVTAEKYHPSPTSLADDYHTYQIEWTPDYVAWALDGVEVRRVTGEVVSKVISAHSLRFNVWSSEATGWVGELDESALPAYQFVNWIRYYRYDNGQFLLDWTDDFDAFDGSRWAKGNWTFDENRVDFDVANAVVQDGTLILAITKEDATGFAGVVPVDPQGNANDAPLAPSNPTAPTTEDPSDDGSGCSLSPAGPARAPSTAAWFLVALAVAALALRRR